MLIEAPNEVLIAGRGTGKTEAILAVKSVKQYFESMPRSCGVLLCSTYQQAGTRTLPALTYGWERLGYKEGTHYLIGQKPTDKWVKQWRWPGPYRPPQKYNYFISWWNGSGAHIVSQDVKGSSNGISIDWIIGDEAKFINEEKYRTELSPANRGLIPAFKDNPNHHGVTFTTDMPLGTAGHWLFDLEKAMDKDKVNRIWELQVARYQLVHLYEKSKKSTELLKAIGAVDAEMKELRFELLYFHTASAIDNIHALGVGYIKKQLIDTTRFQFDTQILNIRPLKLEDGFYPDLDEEMHGYYDNNNEYLESLEYNFEKLKVLDCRKDNDLNLNAPIHIALDYNRRIHPLVVGQPIGNELRIINAMDVEYPDKLPEIITKFCNYYRFHKRKVVYYWFDQTAVGDQHATRICDDVQRLLSANGWTVITCYFGNAPEHVIKYNMWGNLLRKSGKYKYTITFNRENCADLITSMYKTQAELKKDAFGKYKKTETDPNFPAKEAPHYSDAIDMLVFGILESSIVYSGSEDVYSQIDA